MKKLAIHIITTYGILRINQNINSENKILSLNFCAPIDTIISSKKNFDKIRTRKVQSHFEKIKINTNRFEKTVEHIIKKKLKLYFHIIFPSPAHLILCKNKLIHFFSALQ